MVDSKITGAAPTSPTDAPAGTSFVGTASLAISSGVSDAKAAAANLAPKLGSYLHAAVHATGYALSFAVVFPAVFIAELVPSENVLVYGIKDGAAAAKRAVSTVADRKVPA